MTTILTPSEQRYIKAHYKIESAGSMARRFGVSREPIEKLIKHWGLVITKEDRFNIHSNAMSTATLKEDLFIEKNYLTMPSKQMATRLNRSDVFIRTRLDVLGLTIPKEVIEQRKMDSRIKPGSTPPNKGKKMSAAVYKKTKHTMFKPGHKPANTLHDLAITQREDHDSGRIYKWIRIREGIWIHLHRFVWTKVFGRIPAKHVVTFKDGDSLNCCPSNLMLISMRANAERNRLTQYPPEVQEVIKLNNRLKKAIHAKKQNRGPAQSSVRRTGRSR